MTRTKGFFFVRLRAISWHPTRAAAFPALDRSWFFNRLLLAQGQKDDEHSVEQ
jgi:hypothetical protein